MGADVYDIEPVRSGGWMSAGSVTIPNPDGGETIQTPFVLKLNDDRTRDWAHVDLRDGAPDPFFDNIDGVGARFIVDLAESTDGGFVGSGNGALVVRFDANGALQWSKRYAEEFEFSGVLCSIAVQEDMVIAAGHAQSERTSASIGGYVVAVDQSDDGRVLWKEFFDDPTKPALCHCHAKISPAAMLMQLSLGIRPHTKVPVSYSCFMIKLSRRKRQTQGRFLNRLSFLIPS